MTREEVQPAWEKIVNVGLSDYNKLSREQRVWFNIEPLTTDGLWGHYVNHGADKNSDIIEDLEYLNFRSTASQLREFNKKYFPNGVPEGPNARQAEFNKYSEKELEEYIEKMDSEFWEICQDLDNALLAHIEKTGIGKE